MLQVGAFYIGCLAHFSVFFGFSQDYIEIQEIFGECVCPKEESPPCTAKLKRETLQAAT